MTHETPSLEAIYPEPSFYDPNLFVPSLTEPSLTEPSLTEPPKLSKGRHIVDAVICAILFIVTNGEILLFDIYNIDEK